MDICIDLVFLLEDIMDGRNDHQDLRLSTYEFNLSVRLM